MEVSFAGGETKNLSTVQKNKSEPRDNIYKLRALIESKIIGQKDLIESMLISLICDGHILIEGMPGLAKTSSTKILAQGIKCEFHRVQFTPDLLPSDLVGTDVFLPNKNDFAFRPGPVFNNILLADEINRAPAKVQSALLEAMEEKQVTVGLTTYKLPKLFMVVATQNPIEHEGTYNLPESQLDRFLLHVIVGYPEREDELKILELANFLDKKVSIPKIYKMDVEDVLDARQLVQNMYIDARLKSYIVSLVLCTRKPKSFNQNLSHWIRHGASPRASIALLKCARALAWLNGDEYVSPDHIQKIAANVLRHRIIPSFEAQADNISNDEIIKQILEVVAIP